MTLVLVNSFHCDRCAMEKTHPVENTPLVQRSRPPQGWTTLQVDGGDKLNHLCAACALDFTAFMSRTVP